MTTAATRFVVGDAVDPVAYAAMERMPRRSAAVELAAELSRRLGGDVVCVPAYELAPERPTTPKTSPLPISRSTASRAVRSPAALR